MDHYFNVAQWIITQSTSVLGKDWRVDWRYYDMGMLTSSACIGKDSSEGEFMVIRREAGQQWC